MGQSRIKFIFMAQGWVSEIKKDLQMKFDGRKPRIFLKHPVPSKLIGKLNRYLNSKVKKQRTHKYGDSSKPSCWKMRSSWLDT